MITPFVEEYLSAYLQGHRTADDTRQILRLIDGGERNDGPLETEFDEVLRRVSKNIPGLTLNFEKLLAGDEIECDPLVSQGNLAILRLDNLFHQAYAAWMKSGGSIQTIKRIMKAEDPATYSHRTEQQVRTDETYPPDAQILNQIVNITLSGFRIQATITHRREHLKNPPASRNGVPGAEGGRGGGVPGDGLSQSNSASKKDPSDNPPPENCDQATQSQPEASARNAAQSNSQSGLVSETGHSTLATGHFPTDLIDENEIFKSNLGDLAKPIEGNTFSLIRGFNKISGLKGYNELKPLVENETIRSKAQNSVSDGVPCSDRCTKRSEHAEAETMVSPQDREEKPASEIPSVPPCETFVGTTNNVSQNPGEEEPITLAQEINSSSPTDHWPLTTGHSLPEPAFHKRE